MLPLPTTVALPSTDDDNYDVQLQRTLVKLFSQINRTVNALSAVPGTVTGTAAPTTGTHAPPEFVWNTSTSELGAVGSKYVLLGWSCVTAGTPGTWRECRALTGN